VGNNEKHLTLDGEMNIQSLEPQLLNRLLYSFDQITSYHRFRSLQAGMPKNEFIEIISNACIESTILNLRMLDEFFSTKNIQSDDVRALHFWDYKPTTFLTDKERRAINKQLAHFTEHRVDISWTGWPVKLWMRKCMNEMITFFDHIEDNLGFDHPLWQEVNGRRKALENLLALDEKTIYT